MLGKQFSTCKYKKCKLLSVTTGKLFEGFVMIIDERNVVHVYIWIVRARIIVTLTVKS